MGVYSVLVVVDEEIYSYKSNYNVLLLLIIVIFKCWFLECGRMFLILVGLKKLDVFLRVLRFDNLIVLFICVCLCRVKDFLRLVLCLIKMYVWVVFIGICIFMVSWFIIMYY